MRRGDFPAAWAISDAVLASRDPATRDDPARPYHQRWVWDGRPFQGRDVLVRCYHGLGDTLQFARYLEPLRRRVASLTLEVQPALLPLLATMTGPDRLIAFDPARPAPPAACDIEIMELAHALRLPPHAVPPPYLYRPATSADACMIARLGVCWQAGGWDPDRSVPASLVGRVLAGRPVVVLQPSGAAALAATGAAVVNPGGCPNAIADTAAVIASLDLVITVDTMVAHLAGALDRPVCLLLKRDADWRWGTPPAASSWYPRARLLRQHVSGDWNPPLAALADILTHGCNLAAAADVDAG